MEGDQLGKKIFLLFNSIILIIGTTAGPLILRLYFIKGGKRIWFSSFLQTAGFPIILIPLITAYIWRRRRSTSTKIFFMNPRVFVASIIIGVILGASNYFYSYGASRLPASTSSLIWSTQLVFTATFAFFLVKQKFTAYSVNAVVLLTVGAVVLGVSSNGDRPAGETAREYAVGFVVTVVGAALGGFALPFVELTYMKAKQAVTYTLVLEIQMAMCVFATVFCTVGMLVNKDFQALPREAKENELGESKY